MAELRIKLKVVDNDVAEEVDCGEEVEPGEEVHVGVDDNFLSFVVDCGGYSIPRGLDECDGKHPEGDYNSGDGCLFVVDSLGIYYELLSEEIRSQCKKEPL